MDFPVEGLCEAGEDADAALAKLMQEQEHAWFLANGGSADLYDVQGSDSEELAHQHDHDSSVAATSSESNAAPRCEAGASAWCIAISDVSPMPIVGLRRSTSAVCPPLDRPS